MLKGLAELIQSKFYTEDEIKVLVTKNCLEFYDKIKSDYEIDKNLILDNEVIIKEIYSTESLKEIIDILEKRLINVSKVISLNSSDKSIKRIVKYIEKNYYTDLKLELLAEIFNYNSAYLGKVFKGHTGMSFNTYLDNIRIVSFDGLLVDYCHNNDICTLVRGVRSEADVNYELQMAHMNKELNPDIETIFLPTNTKYSFISSSLIKEVLAFDADVRNLVPEQVLIALKNKSKGRE